MIKVTQVPNDQVVVHAINDGNGKVRFQELDDLLLLLLLLPLLLQSMHLLLIHLTYTRRKQQLDDGFHEKDYLPR